MSFCYTKVYTISASGEIGAAAMAEDMIGIGIILMDERETERERVIDLLAKPNYQWHTISL